MRPGHRQGLEAHCSLLELSAVGFRNSCWNNLLPGEDEFDVSDVSSLIFSDKDDEDKMLTFVSYDNKCDLQL